MAIHVWLFVTMGRTSHTPPRPHPSSPSSPSASLTVLPEIHSILVTKSPLPPPQEGGRCRSPPSFPFWFCPPRGPLVVDTVLRVMAQMHSRPSICPTRAQTTRERGGGLDRTRFGSCPPVISCLCEVRGGGSQVIVYTGIKREHLFTGAMLVTPVPFEPTQLSVL